MAVDGPAVFYNSLLGAFFSERDLLCVYDPRNCILICVCVYCQQDAEGTKKVSPHKLCELCVF